MAVFQCHSKRATFFESFVLEIVRNKFNCLIPEFTERP